MYYLYHALIIAPYLNLVNITFVKSITFDGLAFFISPPLIIRSTSLLFPKVVNMSLMLFKESFDEIFTDVCTNGRSTFLSNFCKNVCFGIRKAIVFLSIPYTINLTAVTFLVYFLLSMNVYFPGQYFLSIFFVRTST